MGIQTTHFESDRLTEVKIRKNQKSNIMPRKAEADGEPINLSEPPKKPRGAYILFGMDARPGIVAANPDMKVTQIMKLVGAAWQELDEGEKAKYHKLSEEDKTRYEEEKDAFLAAGGDADALTKKPRKSKK